jgi:type 1 glutamine amidotransferase
MKKVLLVTDGLFHPPLLARQILRRTLDALEGYSFQHIRSLEKLPADLNTFAAIVLYFHHEELSAAALEKLDAFVSTGGGLLGIHTATASFKKVPRYFEILGGRFIGHGPLEKFVVTPVGHKDVFSGIPAFEVLDELYMHELQPGIEVHFTANQEGEDIPVVWTYSFGEGKVCYATPGHRAETLRNKSFQKLLQQGLAWVTDA